MECDKQDDMHDDMGVRMEKDGTVINDKHAMDDDDITITDKIEDATTLQLNRYNYNLL